MSRGDDVVWSSVEGGDKKGRGFPGGKNESKRNGIRKGKTDPTFSGKAAGWAIRPAGRS